MSDKVIVRIWTSGLNRHRPGENVGHVSLEIVNAETKESAYVSLWPCSLEDRTACWHSYPEDRNAEGRNPEYLLVFYQLNILRMLAKYDEEKSRIGQWRLFANNQLLGEVNADSCSGLAYAILTAGGIEDFLERADHYQLGQSSGTNYSSSFYGDSKSSGSARGTENYTFYYAVPPDQLGDRLIRAKQAELRMYPETASHVKHAGETDVTEITVSRPSVHCVIG